MVRIFLIWVSFVFSGGIMADSNHIHHSIDYIEFRVNDLAKAKAFYHSAFGCPGLFAMAQWIHVCGCDLPGWLHYERNEDFFPLV